MGTLFMSLPTSIQGDGSGELKLKINEMTGKRL